MKIKSEELFTKYGSPIKGLRYAIDVLLTEWKPKCPEIGLKLLKRKAELNQITLSDIYRICGNGSPRQPGKLAQYLFNLPSANEIRKIKIENDFGAGI